MASGTRILEYISVSISAPAMSMMMYDNCSADDQVGFLVGGVSRIEGVVYERNREGVKIAIKTYKFRIHIKSIFVCPEINLYKIGDYEKKIPNISMILGWFTRRELITTNPINSLKLTFTEKLIHRNLGKVKRFLPLPFFTGCVINPYKNASRNFHSYDIKFFQLDTNRFLEVGIENSVPELRSYQLGFFHLQNKRKDFLTSYQDEILCKKNGNHEDTDNLIEKLAVAETDMFILLQEINDISKDMKRLQKNKIIKQQKKTQIQKKSKKKPLWITKLEGKHLYRNSKIVPASQ